MPADGPTAAPAGDHGETQGKAGDDEDWWTK
jgi:hypothetical protein